MKKKAFGLAFLVTVAVLQFAVGSPAGAITYVYTGNSFTTINDSALGNNITAYFLFDNSVNTNSGTVTDPGKILLWKVTTGNLTIDSATGTLENISFTFVSNNLGSGITTWSFTASSPAGYTMTSNGDWSTGDGTGEDLVMLSPDHLINSNSNIPNYWQPTALSLAELEGSWISNSLSLLSGGSTWEKDSITVNVDGSFTGFGTLSSGHAGVLNGDFMQSTDGLLVSYGVPDNTLCQAAVDNTVFACTGGSGNPNLTIATKLGDSYTSEDLAGTWQGYMLAAGNATSWSGSVLRIGTNGTFTGNIGKANLSGGFSISGGWVNCGTGCGGYPNLGLAMDAGKTVMIGTSTATDGTTPQLWIYTKLASSYSLTDLAGDWQLSSLVSGSDPLWQRAAITADKHGNLTQSLTDSTNGTPQSKQLKMTISPTGVIKCATDPSISMYMDAGKTVIAYTKAPSHGTPAVGILTKAPLEISGTATIAGGAYLPGATMEVVIGTVVNQVTTGSLGAYTLGGLANGTYTVTPSMQGYTFAPKSKQVSVLGVNASGVNFTGTPIAISGQIIPFSGKKLSNPLITPSISVVPGSVWWTFSGTDVNGNYTISPVPNGVYTVTPSSNAHQNVPAPAKTLTFSPASAKVTIGGKSATKVNFHYVTDSTCSKCH